jgi:hypothetical protein
MSLLETIADMQCALEGKLFDALYAIGFMYHALRKFILKQMRLLRDHLASGGSPSTKEVGAPSTLAA